MSNKNITHKITKKKNGQYNDYNNIENSPQNITFNFDISSR